MARKKKEIIETPIEEKQEETKTTSTDNLSYQGTVKVSIQKGKKILSSKTYHNTGKANLFKFICNCLAGNYDGGTRPCKIALFTGSVDEGIDGKDNVLFKDTNLCTPAVLNDTTAVVNLITDNDKKYYSVTYHFRIPYSYINSNTIYKAALFNSSPTLATTENIVDSLYATYKFITKSGTTNIWSPIEINAGTDAGNFSIIIEWTMTIKNLTSEEN